jgi:hypothetical protein
MVYQVSYDVPVVHAYGTDLFDYFNEEDIELVGKRERLPTGFAKFIRKVEE